MKHKQPHPGIELESSIPFLTIAVTLNALSSCIGTLKRTSCNGHRRREWTRHADYKSSMKLNISLRDNAFGKSIIPSPSWLWVNSGTDWAFWSGNWYKRRKTLNSNQLYSTKKITLWCILTAVKEWRKYIQWFDLSWMGDLSFSSGSFISYWICSQHMPKSVGWLNFMTYQLL